MLVTVVDTPRLYVHPLRSPSRLVAVAVAVATITLAAQLVVPEDLAAELLEAAGGMSAAQLRAVVVGLQ